LRTRGVRLIPDVFQAADVRRRWWWQGPDYGCLLPVLAALPTGVGHMFSRWRGSVNARWSRDWAELSVGEAYVASRTAATWQALRPDADALQVEQWVRSRYQTVALEELTGMQLARGCWRGRTALAAPFKAALTAAPAGGMVWLQAHFGNPLMGCVALAQGSGRRVWVTMSSITDHERVHPQVSGLFRNKYAHATRWLNGGGFVDSEKPATLRQLYRALQQGDWVVMMADLPAAPGQAGVCVPWLGGNRLLAEGAMRLLAQSGAGMGAMWMQTDGPKEWCLNGMVAGAETPHEAYASLARVLLDQPGAWWAAHLWLESRACEPMEGR